MTRFYSKIFLNTIRSLVYNTNKMEVPKIKLNDGHEMPVFGLGTYKVINFLIYVDNILQ